MFSIENSSDKLALLQSDLERLKKTPLDISLAEKACSDAWHLSDWVYSEISDVNKKMTEEVFRTKLYSECPEMRILHDLANSFKHKKLTRPKVKIRKTIVHGGAFSSAFSKAFDVSRLEVHYNDESKIDVDDLIKLAIEFWKKKLKDVEQM